MAVDIKVIRIWSDDNVMAVCRKYGFYTCGDCQAYAHMLDQVSELEPTPENIYAIAKDIHEHSSAFSGNSRNQSITCIMDFLEKEAVHTLYRIAE